MRALGEGELRFDDFLERDDALLYDTVHQPTNRSDGAKRYRGHRGDLELKFNFGPAGFDLDLASGAGGFELLLVRIA